MRNATLGLLACALFCSLGMTVAQAALTSLAQETKQPLRLELETEALSDQVAGAQARAMQGIRHYLDGEYGQAIFHLRKSISALRLHAGPQSQLLMEPQAYLGLALQNVGDHESALDELTRAQHLVQLNGGVVDPAQTRLILAKVESLEAIDDFWLAEQVYSSLAKSNRQTFGELDLRTISATRQFGDWLTAVGRYRTAISHFRNANKRLAQAATGDEHAGMVIYHVGRAQALLSERSQWRRGISELEKAANLVTRFDDHYAPADQIKVIVSLGEILMRSHREQEAIAQFELAHSILIEHQDDAEAQAQWSEFLQNVRVVTAAMPAVEPDFSGPTFEVSFDIRPDGRPTNIEVLGTSNLTVRSYVKRVFAWSRFQPPLTNNGAVAAPNQSMVVTFPKHSANEQPPAYQPIFGYNER